MLMTMSFGANAQSIEMPKEWEESIWEVKPLYRCDTLEICFVGDIMMHQKQIETAHKNDGTYDFSTYFHHLEKHIRSADIAVGNMEFTLGGKPYTGYPAFSAPDSYATYIADIGFDIFLLANNHIFDKGANGAKRTLDIYDRIKESHGIMITGLAGNDQEMHDNNPLIFRQKGISVAMLNFTYGTNVGSGAHWPKTNYLSEVEKAGKAFEAATKADITIALPHWGIEYDLHHSQSQRKKAEELIRNGADIIIGSHPHVVQDTDIIQEVPVIYSMGNAVSNMSAPNTQVGLMVTIHIIRNGNGDIYVDTPQYRLLWCSRPGGYCNSYTVLPISEFIGTRDEWIGGWEYDKMIRTYHHVMNATGITE